MTKLGNLLMTSSWFLLIAVDLFGVVRTFGRYGSMWGIAAVIFPPMWVITPFITGLAVPFLIGLVLLSIGAILQTAGKPADDWS